jgi:hypothetical protein
LNRHARLHNRTEEELAAKARRRRVKSLSVSSASPLTSSTTPISSPISSRFASQDAIFMPQHDPSQPIPMALPLSSHGHLPHRRYSDIPTGGRKPSFFGWTTSPSIGPSHLVRSVDSGIIPLPQPDEPWEVFADSPLSSAAPLAGVQAGTRSQYLDQRKKNVGVSSIDIYYEGSEGSTDFSPLSNSQDLFNSQPHPHHHQVEYLQQHHPQSPHSPYPSPHQNSIYLPPPSVCLPLAWSESMGQRSSTRFW